MNYDNVDKSFFESGSSPDPEPAPLARSPIKPLFANVLALREEQERYSGSLIIPETAYEKPMGARVIEVGPEVKHVKPGDFLLVGKYAGAEIQFRNRRYVVIREDEILGVVDESV
jgi:chaperonin GroES